MKTVARDSDCALYSEIMLSVSDIKLKKEYMACPNCRKATIRQESTLYHCIKCSLIVDAIPTLIISLILADSTGSFEVEIIGQKVEIFI